MQSPTISTQDTTLSKTSLPFTCGCSRLLNGKPFSSLFTREYYESMRDCCAKMTKAKLDNLLLGEIILPQQTRKLNGSVTILQNSR